MRRVFVMGPAGAPWRSGLRHRLDALFYEVVEGGCCVSPVGAVLDVAPDVLVLCLCADPVPAVEFVTVLKRLRPELRVIVVAETSDPSHAAVVEAGVFYYTAAPSVEELAQAVEAAVRSIEGARKGSGRYPGGKGP